MANECGHHHIPYILCPDFTTYDVTAEPRQGSMILTLSVKFLLPIIKVGTTGEVRVKIFGPSQLEEHWGVALAKNGRLGFSQVSRVKPCMQKFIIN